MTDSSPPPQHHEPILGVPPILSHAPPRVPERMRPSAAQLASLAICWMVIGVLTLTLMILNQFPLTPPETGGEATPLDLVQINTLGKFLIGGREVAGLPVDPDQWKLLRDPNWEVALCETALLNELSGPQPALERLKQLESSAPNPLPLTENQQRLYRTLEGLFESYRRADFAASDIAADDRAFLAERLGWCGGLAAAPANTPDVDRREAVTRRAATVFVATVVVTLLGLVFLLAGGVGLLAALIALCTGNLRRRFRARRGHGVIYAETFALWFAGFVAISLILGSLQLPDSLIWLTTSVVFALSLSSLGWARLRGIPWSQLRQDLGWTRGQSLFVEIRAGLIAYVCLLPPLALAMALIVALSQFLGLATCGGWPLLDNAMPTHPLVETLLTARPWSIATVLLAACVAAPLVEETVFRGILYRHLRNISIVLPVALSVIASASINALIFAAIHPQGLMGIPVLAVLATGFSLVREWRDSLIAPIFMHALNNGLVTGLLLLVLR